MSQEKIEIFAKMFNVTHEELIFESENEMDIENKDEIYKYLNFNEISEFSI